MRQMYVGAWLVSFVLYELVSLAHPDLVFRGLRPRERRAVCVLDVRDSESHIDATTVNGLSWADVDTDLSTAVGVLTIMLASEY
jgi:hypothetical protein